MFAASVDTVEDNAAFAASLGIDYPILSDPDRAVARAWGVLAPSGFASRWTFFIGGDRRLLAIDTTVGFASHGADVVRTLRALGVAETPLTS